MQSSFRANHDAKFHFSCRVLVTPILSQKRNKMFQSVILSFKSADIILADRLEITDPTFSRLANMRGFQLSWFKQDVSTVHRPWQTLNA